MPWLPNEHMGDVHIIRQDVARALAAYGSEPCLETRLAMEAQLARRGRAIRMIHDEDGASVRHLAMMFRCSKTVIREVLAAKENQ